MDRRTPSNPRFKNVKPVVDSGASVTKYKEKIEEMKRNYRIQKDEIFKRIKISTLVQLVMQVAEVEGIFNPALVDDEEENDTKSDTQRSAFERLANGEGELHSDGGSKAASHGQMDMPYLLLDIRDGDDYAASHIISAQNFPHTLLSRSDNYQTKEMLSFRNQDGKIIVIYDDDEKMAPRVGTVLVQRGYDNVFMLSGGLRLAKKLFPDGLITGNPGSGDTKKDHFDDEDINSLSIYLDNALQSMTTSRMSTARSNTSRSTTSTTKPAPFR